MDLVEEAAGHLLPSGALQVQSEVTDRPLASMDVVVVVLHEMGTQVIKTVAQGKWP